jgi:hypothetical protein
MANRGVHTDALWTNDEQVHQFTGMSVIPIMSAHQPPTVKYDTFCEDSHVAGVLHGT